MEDLWTHQTTVRHRNHDVGQFSAYTLTFHKHFCCPTLTHFWLTCLMISEAYRLSAHTSVAPTLTEILQVFWCQAPAKQVWFCILFLLQICCGRGCQSHLSSQWCFAHLENLFPYLWKKIFFFKYKMTISGPSTHSLIESIIHCWKVGWENPSRLLSDLISPPNYYICTSFPLTELWSQSKKGCLHLMRWRWPIPNQVTTNRGILIYICWTHLRESRYPN